MPYSTAESTQLMAGCEQAWMDLLRLHVRFDQQANDLGENQGREYIKYGVGRRYNLIGFALRKIYRIFPPDRTRNLNQQELADVQINLHAFVINVAGCFDSMAWAFVVRHNLLNEVGGQQGVGLFLKSTSRFLPKAIKDNLDSQAATAWHRTYLKDYRDALAHRIPLYVPPSVFTAEDGARYNALEQEKLAALQAGQLDRIEALEEEQAMIGRPCFSFMHSFDPARPVALHPQVVADTRTVVEFGRIFVDHWHERAA